MTEETGRRLRQLAGGVLLVLSGLPLYRLLATPGTGAAGEATVAQTAVASEYLFASTLLLLVPALLAARMVAPASASRFGARIAAAIERPGAGAFALFAALLAFVITAVVNQRVLNGEPTLIDAMSQLVHARYFAAGMLSGPTSELTPFWHTQQMLVTANGWVSQYPPGHVALLALGLALGMVEWVGAVVLGLTVLVTALLVHRLLPEARLEGRVGVLLLAASPFAAAHAAAYMNHATAALFAVSALYCGVRVVQGGGAGAAAGVGLALSALFATRPLTAVVMGGVVGLLVLGGFGHARARASLLAVAVVSAVPLLLLLALYNQHFFGAATRFGYTAALGPDGGLGFGVDPWGNTYGVRAAIGYTSAELATLNLYLLESPLPVVVLVALYLVLARQLAAGERMIALWALAPLVAHLFYWHHGLHMGPRMLNEYAPAWCLLVALAGVRLLTMAPFALRGMPDWSPRVFVGTALLGAWLAAVAFGVPTRLAGYGRSSLPVEETLAALGSEDVVFVHGSWGSRVAMQMAARGMRLDTLDAVVRASSTCLQQRWLDGEPVSLVFERAAGTLMQRELPGGSRITVAPGESWSSSCEREAASDRYGVLEVTPYLWRGGLPGLEGSRPLLARDLGPALNERLLTEPGRRAHVLIGGDRQQVRLLPYPEGSALLWTQTP